VIDQLPFRFIAAGSVRVQCLTLRLRTRKISLWVRIPGIKTSQCTPLLAPLRLRIGIAILIQSFDPERAIPLATVRCVVGGSISVPFEQDKVELALLTDAVLPCHGRRVAVDTDFFQPRAEVLVRHIFRWRDLIATTRRFLSCAAANVPLKIARNTPAIFRLAVRSPIIVPESCRKMNLGVLHQCAKSLRGVGNVVVPS